MEAELEIPDGLAAVAAPELDRDDHREPGGPVNR